MPIIIGNTNSQGNEIADSMARVADSIWGKGAQQAALLGAQTDVAKQQAYKLSDENTRRTAYFNALKSGDATSAAAVANAAASGDMAALAAAHLFRTATSQGATAPATQAAQVAAGQGYGNTYGKAAMDDATARRGQTFALEGTKYSADTSAAASRYGHDTSAAASRYGHDTSAAASRYGHDTSAQAQRDVANINNDRAITAGIGPDGRPTFARNSDAARGAIAPMVTAEQAKGALLAPYTSLGQPQQAAPAPQPQTSFILRGPDGSPLGDPNASGSPLVPPATMAAPTARNLTNTVARPQPPVLGANVGGGTENMPPDVRTMFGLPTGNTEYLDPNTGAHFTSQNGGQTAVPDGGGAPVPVLGSGLAAVGGPTAFQDVQSMNARRQMLSELDKGEPTPDSSQIMGDLANLPPGAVRDVQGLLNAGAGLTGLNAFLPGGEVGADTNRATQRLSIFRNQMLRAFKNSEAFGIKEQRNVEDILPGEGLFTNPTTEAKKIPELYKFLVDQRAMLRQYAKSLPASEIPKVLQAIHDNNKALQMLTSPKWGAEGGAAPAGAPAAPQGGGAPAPRSGGPQPGDIEDGHRFKGGDPGNPASWEPI